MTRKTNFKRESCSANPDETITPSKRVRNILKQNKDHLNIIDIKAKTEPQRQMIRSFINGSNIVAVGSAGTGKAQPLHSKILLKDGWSTMGEVEVGDIVITPDNSTANVIGIFEQGMKPVYKIHFKDESVTESCGEHLWEVYVPKNLKYRRYSTKQVLQTKDLIEILNDKSDSVNISIDYVNRIEFPEKELKIDPYILGCLLGDGGLTTRQVTITSMDSGIISEIENRLLEGFKLNIRKSTTRCQSYSIIKDSVRNNKKNEYVELLDGFGLIGKKSFEKFIPECYINSSVEQRLLLIRGLLDTDGTVGKGRVSYSTSSEIMAKQVKEIILSLGGKCTISNKRPFYRDKNDNKIFGKINYILHIKTKNDKELFNLPRKICLASSEYQPEQFRRIISKIEFVGELECKCILIDDPKHLYITDDYIITHNTYLALYLALKDIIESKLHSKIIIIRSNVPTRNSGFLPGSLEEKNEIYALPFRQIVNGLCENGSAWDILTKKKIIEFVSTSYIRGLTFDDAIVIVEEAQNLDAEEMKTVLTRIGENTQFMICGDSKQGDLFRSREKSGFELLIYIAENMHGYIDLINFLPRDIVRSGFVKKLLLLLEDSKFDNA